MTGRYLLSRRHLAGTAGALAGVGLHLAGVVGDVWPVVAIGLYAVGALAVPPERVEEPPVDPGLLDALRAEVEAQLTRVELRRAELPAGAERAVRGIARTVRVVLERLDVLPDLLVDRAAAPDRLAEAAEIVRSELAESLDSFFARTPAAGDAAARELLAQLGMIGDHADRLAAQVPDVHARRAEELTREMRRRHER